LKKNKSLIAQKFLAVKIFFSNIADFNFEKFLSNPLLSVVAKRLRVFQLAVGPLGQARIPFF